jgi:hypothetical protein
MRFFTLILFLAVVNDIIAQLDTSIWNSTKNIEHNKFIAEIPQTWKEVKLTENAEYLFKFEMTGIGMQTIFNASPVPAFFTIAESNESNTQAVRQEQLNDFHNFADKVQEPNYVYDSTSFKIKTRQEGTIYHTRFYRRSKASNYSRYFLIVENPANKKNYVLTFWYQYKSPTYDIERALFFKEYAERTFSKFSFR